MNRPTVEDIEWNPDKGEWEFVFKTPDEKLVEVQKQIDFPVKSQDDFPVTNKDETIFRSRFSGQTIFRSALAVAFYLVISGLVMTTAVLLGTLILDSYHAYGWWSMVTIWLGGAVLARFLRTDK